MRITKTALIVMIFAGLGGLLYGFDIGVVSGALPLMEKTLGITKVQGGYLIAAVLYGGALATFFSGPAADRFGRRALIQFSAVVFLIGDVLFVVAPNYELALAGRLIQGVGIGVITIVIPLYLAETVPTHLRGRGVAVFQLSLTFGILVGYLVNDLLQDVGSSLNALLSGYGLGENSADWRLMFATVLVPNIIFLIGGFWLLPRSPRWLYQHGFADEAHQVLSKAQHSDAHVKEAVSEIQAVIADEKKQSGNSWALLFHSRYFKAFFIAVAIGVLNQLCGINVLLQFNATILKDSGLNLDTAVLATVGVGAVNFLLTIVALSLVDKLGRRPLLIVGTAGVTLSLVFIGLVHAFMAPGAALGYATFGGFIAFIVFFAVGPGVVVWLAISEILPLAIRAKGMAVALAANSLVSAGLASVFMVIVGLVGYQGMFLLMAFFTVLYLLIALFWLPETKGRSLEEVERELLGSHAP